MSAADRLHTRPTTQQAFTRMSENCGLNGGDGGGEVNGGATCWALVETEYCRVVDGVETCGVMDGRETCRAMDANCCEIWVRIATDCCW